MLLGGQRVGNPTTWTTSAPSQSTSHAMDFNNNGMNALLGSFPTPTPSGSGWDTRNASATPMMGMPSNSQVMMPSSNNQLTDLTRLSAPRTMSASTSPSSSSYNADPSLGMLPIQRNTLPYDILPTTNVATAAAAAAAPPSNSLLPGFASSYGNSLVPRPDTAALTQGILRTSMSPSPASVSDISTSTNLSGPSWTTLGSAAVTAVTTTTPSMNSTARRGSDAKGAKARPFVCTQCPRAFSRKHDLERHARVHSGDRPYICRICKKGFPRSDALRRHIRVERDTHESYFVSKNSDVLDMSDRDRLSSGHRKFGT